MCIYLVGMMGAGKTTIGRALSTYLNYQFVDLDGMIEAHYGMSISQIFQQFGEVAFRKTESEMLTRCSTYKETIVATGGGIVEQDANCAYLKTRNTIFLDGSAALLWERVKADSNRPLRADWSLFQERYHQRQDRYTAVASSIIDIEEKTIKDIVAEILFQLAQQKECDD